MTVIPMASSSVTSTMDAQIVNGEHKPEKKDNLPRLYSRVSIDLEGLVLPEEKLSNSPSLSDGVDAETERNLRLLGCELIQSGSILLKLPQVAAATGQVLFQRLFYARSFARYNFEITAMACLYLASKIEEAPRRLRDIINVFHRLKQIHLKQSNKALILDQDYTSRKNEVIKQERRVLNTLGFCVHVKHPHKLITTYLNILDLDTNRHLVQSAWNLMNDGLRTDIFVRYVPETIACACIYLAARSIKRPVVLPDGWWTLFDVREDELIEISYKIRQLYHMAKPNWPKLEKKINDIRHVMFENQNARKDPSYQGGQTPNPNLPRKFSPVNSPSDKKSRYDKPRDKSRKKRHSRSDSEDKDRRKKRTPRSSRSRSPSPRRSKKYSSKVVAPDRRPAKDRRSPSPIERKKKKKARSSDRDRLKRREDEVKQALKRRRPSSSSSPEPPPVRKRR